MKFEVTNAIIMAAGLSSRFAPISYEKPKALIQVKGEVLIERQIRQLKKAGIKDIIIVVGYQKDKFYYLKDKFDVVLVENPEYLTRNNNYSLYVAKDYLHNTYICSADNYFTINPFEQCVDESYYAAVYSEGQTEEWCLTVNEQDYITQISIGGADSWIMLGHVFFSEVFSQKFIPLLEKLVEDENLKLKLWEYLLQQNLEILPMKIRKYTESDIFEFDSLDELRLFDEHFWMHSDSSIMQDVAIQLDCKEAEINQIEPLKDEHGSVYGIMFEFDSKRYQYGYQEKKVHSYE